jgi:hypothetical protein
MSIKRRLVSVEDLGHWVNYNFPPGSDPYSGVKTEGDSFLRYIQETVSTKGGSPLRPGSKTDNGGDFSTQKVLGFHASDSGVYSLPGRTVGKSYVGGEFAVNPNEALNEAFKLVAPSNDIYLRAKGSTAIARCAPTNPVADAGTFIGELKSGLPKLVGRELFKTKFKDYRKVGGEYLNVEFGWKPLISDLQKFGKAAQDSEKILHQLHRDSGKNVRRRYTFPDENSYTTETLTRRQSVLTGGANDWVYWRKSSGGTNLVVERSVHTKTWFSGAFTYHLNLGNTLPDKIARHAAEARKLYGVELTPATVWNLAPWSWIVDWEGNIGDVLHNVSRFSQDGLVLRYGYIMQQKTAKVDYTLGSNGRVLGSPDTNLTLSIVAQSKIRRRATPFGFGFDMTALTGRQSAILGALGISRGPRHG